VFTQSKNVWKHIQLIIAGAASVIDITKGEFTKVGKLNNNNKYRHVQQAVESRYFRPFPINSRNQFSRTQQ